MGITTRPKTAKQLCFATSNCFLPHFTAFVESVNVCRCGEVNILSSRDRLDRMCLNECSHHISNITLAVLVSPRRTVKDVRIDHQNSAGNGARHAARRFFLYRKNIASRRDNDGAKTTGSVNLARQPAEFVRETLFHFRLARQFVRIDEREALASPKVSARQE